MRTHGMSLAPVAAAALLLACEPDRAPCRPPNAPTPRPTGPAASS